MKKGILFMALAATVAFSSCSKDDDDKNSTCETCTVQGQKIEMCENEDGSFTLNSGGETETVTAEELGGLSAKAYIDIICSLGG